MRWGLAAGGVLALVAVDYGVWRIAAERLMSGYLHWQTSLGVSGWQVSSAPPVATGWPVAAVIRLDGARLGQADPGGFAWTAERVRFGVSLLHPGTLAVTPEGAQAVVAPGWTTLRFHGGIEARAPLTAPIRSAEAVATELSAGTPYGDAVVHAGRIVASWQPGATQVAVTAGPATLPDGRRWGLGRTVAAAEIAVIARGDWPKGAPAEAAAAWRDAKGGVEVTHVALRWGTLDASGSGRAGLDGNLQPAATVDLQVIDPGSALSMLADTGAISRGKALAGEAVLALLAMASNTPGVLDVPMRVQDGSAYLGQIPLAKVPPLRWGQAAPARAP